MLEQSIQSAQEMEKSLHLIQESLTFIDKQLAAYIADKVDAAQMPQEAQASTSGNELLFFCFYYLNKILLTFYYNLKFTQLVVQEVILID